MRKIHLAIAATASQPGALETNLKQIVDFAHRAARDGARLLLTPEMSATGYGSYPEVLALAEVAGEGKVYAALSETARETGVVICAGFVEQSSNNKYLAHYIVYPDDRFLVQRKHCITPTEQPLVSAPPDFKVFEVDDVKCAITICADSGFPNIAETLRERGVELLLMPTGAGGKREDRVTDEDLKTAAGRANYLRVLETVFFPGDSITRGIELRQAWAAVNLAASDGRDHHHLGHGMICNAMGEVLGFFHGQPNLYRQKPMYAHAEVDVDDVCE